MKEESLQILLTECLGTTDSDQVLIVFDESLAPYQEALLRSLIKRRLLASFQMVPKEYQHALVDWAEGRSHVSDIPLPTPLRTALGESSVILNLLDADPRTARVRRAVLQQTRLRDCRLAHIPGISLEILEVLAKSPLASIGEACEMVAWSLGQALEARIISRDRRGVSYELRVSLGGWSNPPLLSPGVIPKGSWGNVPPGETFWCPNTPTGDGEICINGSIPGARLEPSDEIVLSFRQGRLESWQAEPGSVGSLFFDKERTYAQSSGDDHWNNFAELGIGLNPAIERLTGNSLFDEKMAGTLHIAIGDNSTFGFNLRAAVHHDLVVQDPTLVLDGREILVAGELDRNLIEEWRKIPLVLEQPLDDSTEIQLHPENFDVVDQLPMRRCQRAGRLGYVRMADGPVAFWIWEVVKALEHQPEGNYGELRSQIEDVLEVRTQLPRIDIDRALAVLHNYQVVEFGKPGRSSHGRRKRRV